MTRRRHSIFVVEMGECGNAAGLVRMGGGGERGANVANTAPA